MESVCVICEQKNEGQTELCARHKLAFDNLKNAYTIWQNALKIDWQSFLIEVSGNQETGQWAKEVAEHMLADYSTASPV